MNIILTANEDGTGTCIHTDAIPLHELGTLTVKRASTIEFNEAQQLWEVRMEDKLTGTWAVYFTDKSRAVCLQWEHDYVQSKM